MNNAFFVKDGEWKKISQEDMDFSSNALRDYFLGVLKKKELEGTN